MNKTIQSAINNIKDAAFQLDKAQNKLANIGGDVVPDVYEKISSICYDDLTELIRTLKENG